MSDQPQPLLFFTSRTARDLFFFCPRARYLGNHFGPSGYGIQPVRQSIPLATGARVHDVFKPVLQWVVAHDEQPPRDLVMTAAAEALQGYRDAVRERGLTYWAQENPERYQRMIQEQEHLIVGLPLLWILHQLPIHLREWRIILAEPREVSVYDCTCGLGDGIPPWDAHVTRGCEGIGLQTGPDFISQHRQSLSHRYDEFKTKGGYLTDAWAESFETRAQITLGTIGVEQKHGITIDQVFLHGLSKGRLTKSGELGEFQDSRLTWAWRKPAVPPVSAEEWEYQYEWWEEDTVTGSPRKRRLGKGWERAWVGDYPGGLPAWIDQLPERIVAQTVRTIGPMLRNPMTKQAALEGWIAVERDIRHRLGIVYDALAAADVAFDWSQPAIQTLLNELFPQSWECQRFGARYACSFKPICHRDPGWQDPFTIGFQHRRPHHPFELAQAVGRGLIPADDVWEGDETE